MNHSEKQFLTKTSPLVIQHIKELLSPFPELPAGVHIINPTHQSNINERRTQIFWRYHGHFQMEFVIALTESLPANYKFINYDHLKNELKVEVQ